jgi:flagellar biosynthesis GTPase FlhF
MVVRTYRGKEMTALLTQIREELGEDAVILSTTRAEGAQIEIAVGTDETVAHAGGQQVTMPPPSRTLSSTQDRVRDALLRQGLHREIAELVAVRGTSSDALDKVASSGLAGLITFDSRLPFEQRVVALVGPTGVGKTTTIAKLAGRMRMAFDVKIGLISADSYRVGAGHQLQTYASLMGLPFRMIDDSLPYAHAIQVAVDSLPDCDLILLDTAGYSPRDTRVDSMSQELSTLHSIEKLLVLPAPGNDVDLRAAATAFGRMGCSRVIVSKTDETGFMGPVVNTLVSLRKPVAFLTTGQRVPEDIEPASARRLGWMLTRVIH